MKYLLILLFLIHTALGFAQETKELTLQQVIKLAKTQSIRAQSVHNQFDQRFWEYKLYKANYLPEITLSGTVPNFNRSINSSLLDNGTQAFVSSSTMGSNLSLGISQKIAKTGTNLSLNSSLNRIDILGNNSSTSYLSTPINLGISQALFTYNPFKWEIKLAPLRYKESQRAFMEAMENIAIDAVNRFFDLMIAQVNQKISRNNKKNNLESFKIAQGRFQMGTIAENDLLQMELSLLQSQNSYEQSKIDLQAAMMNLKTFLGITSKEKIELKLPKELYKFSVNSGDALEYALNNRKDVIQYQRQLTEAESAVAQARMQQFQLNLFANVGLSKQGFALNNIYKNPQNQQRVNFGISVPIINWGKGKAQRKIAESNYNLTVSNLTMARSKFEREIFLAAMGNDIIYNRVLTAAKADTIGTKRYNITRQRYLIGRIEITELNLSSNAKDGAKRNYLQALQDYWSNYYSLRRLTLYDFYTKESLVKSPLPR